MDLFDWLGVIGRLRTEGMTQVEIGEKIGWSRGAVSQYAMLQDKVATRILEIAKGIQRGLVATDATTGNNFTERWFRDSGGGTS